MTRRMRDGHRPTPARRLLLVTVAVFFAFAAHAHAQTACGGLLQPECPPPPPAATEPSPAPPLSAERFTVLEQLYASVVRFYHPDFDGDDIRAYGRACRALSTGDPLLLGVRRVCAASDRTLDRYLRFLRCRTDRGCSRTLRLVRSSARREIHHLRRSNGTIVREVEVVACRSALRATRAEVQYATRWVRGLDELQRAVDRGSERARERAFERLNSIPFDHLPTGEEALAGFRAACR